MTRKCLKTFSITIRSFLRHSDVIDFPFHFFFALRAFCLTLCEHVACMATRVRTRRSSPVTILTFNLKSVLRFPQDDKKKRRMQLARSLTRRRLRDICTIPWKFTVMLLFRFPLVATDDHRWYGYVSIKC